MTNHKEDAARAYKRLQIESASPGQLVVLLYDGAIEYLNRAEIAFTITIRGLEWIEKFHNNLISCQNILTELIVSLDMQKGGEVATNLFRLYEYMHYRLVDANIKKELDPLKEVRGLLSGLRDAFKSILVQEKDLPIKPPRRGLNLQG